MLNYLHFLGHASHNSDNPGESFLELSDRRELKLSYMLRYLDFSNYFLVCLASCETGVTSPQDPLNEYVGLHSAFLAQGANSVISTLWKIDDISTTIMMLKFYDEIINNYQKPQHPAVALRKSQQWFRQKNRDEISDWCRNQALYLGQKLDDISGEIQNRSILTKLKIDIDKIYLHAINLLKKDCFPDEYPYSHPYFWAGFIFTGLLGSRTK